MYEEILKGITVGMFYGAQAALFGYLKGEDLPISWKIVFSKKFWETFSWSKALKTVALGAVMGGISQGYGFIKPQDWAWFTEYTGIPQISLPVIMNFANTAVVMGTDQFIKFVARRTPLIRMWDALKLRMLKMFLAQEKLIAILAAEEAKVKQKELAEKEENPS